MDDHSWLRETDNEPYCTVGRGNDNVPISVLAAFPWANDKVTFTAYCGCSDREVDTPTIKIDDRPQYHNDD